MISRTNTIWKIDSNHSTVQFKVRHLAVSYVSGVFTVFSGEIRAESDDFNNAQIHFEIDTDSLITNNSERDGHLKSPLFFDCENFPKITFKGSLHKKDDFKLAGELTMLKTTKAITLNVEFLGTGKGRFDDTRAGFEFSGKLNRKDYGLDFGLLTETGNLVVGEEIKLHFDIQAIQELMENTASQKI